MIETEAFTNMLVVDGDPTNNLDLIADPKTNLRVIVKGRQVPKNALWAIGKGARSRVPLPTKASLTT